MPTREESLTNATTTCDRCRSLKVKCHPAESSSTTLSVDSSSTGNPTEVDGGYRSFSGDGPSSPTKKNRGVCRRCKKAGVDCTFEYEFKKSGRPLGSVKRSTTRERDSTPNRSASPSRPIELRRQSTTSTLDPSQSHPVLHSGDHSPATSTHTRSQSHNPAPRPYYELTPTSNPFLSPPLPPPPVPSTQTQLDHILNPTNSAVQNHGIIDNIQLGSNIDISPQGQPESTNYNWGSMRESIFGSARTALEGVIPGEYNFNSTFPNHNNSINSNTSSQPPWLSGLFSRRHSFDFNIPDGEPNEGMAGIGRLDPSGSNPGSFDLGRAGTGGQVEDGMVGGQPRGTGVSVGGGMGGFGPSPSAAGVSQSFPGTATSSTMPISQSDYFSDLGGPVPQVESIGTWSEFCFFFSLFMRHQHALVPLVHKPSFAMDVLNRRDLRDEPFRGLLFSIVTYTICQSPLSMMSKDLARERLLLLMEHCQRWSRIIHIRQSARPSLITAASIELDILSSQATNKQELTSALFSDAQRGIYALRLHARDLPDGSSAIDVELGRRIFWHLYTTDKTNVMNGGHGLVHHQEGLPPLPLELDDEHLSGVIPSQIHGSSTMPSPHQPFSTKQTYIAGFVTLIKIFTIIGECQSRHRTLSNDPEASQDLPTLGRWLERAVERLRRITDTLPSEYKPAKGQTPSGGLGGVGGVGVVSGMDDEEAIKGIQQANICITALCAEFALLDLRLALRPEEDLRPERETIAKKAYSTLSSIPIEYLASNGEAMRGKVLRTILALFNASTSPQELGDSVWDWWSMYSQVQFVQVIPST